MDHRRRRHEQQQGRSILFNMSYSSFTEFPRHHASVRIDAHFWLEVAEGRVYDVVQRELPGAY